MGSSGHHAIVTPDVEIGLLRTLLSRNDGAWVTCGGSSMLPAFAPGARLRVVPCATPRVGDVVLFAAGDCLITHRVLARVPGSDGGWILHAGDSGWGAGFVRRSDVLGRVLAPRRRPPVVRRLLALTRALWIAIAARGGVWVPMTARSVPDPRTVAGAYDAGAEAFDARFAADPRTVRRFATIDEPQRSIARGARSVLELGCGTGRLLAVLDGRVRVGVDVSGGLLRVAAGKGLTVLRADAHALPFADGSFDAIAAGNAVFRYLDYPRAFAECARVLRRGGRLAVHQYSKATFGLRSALRRAPADTPLHVGDLDEVRGPARGAGFAEEAVHLWRTLSFWPYVLRLPEPLSWRLWDHVTFVFRKA